MFGNKLIFLFTMCYVTIVNTKILFTSESDEALGESLIQKNLFLKSLNMSIYFKTSRFQQVYSLEKKDCN